MANRVNRYRSQYERIVRDNSTSTWPKHVFMKGQNIKATVKNRIGDRTNCFEATLNHLTERFNDREVYLVGTLNASNMLALRTKKLI